MTHVRTEKNTTPIGQETYNEWFVGTPEEAEALLANGKCDGLDVLYNGDIYCVTRSRLGKGLNFWQVGEDASMEAQYAQKMIDAFPAEAIEFSPGFVMTI